MRPPRKILRLRFTPLRMTVRWETLPSDKSTATLIGRRTANGRPYSANPSAPCFRQTSPRRAEGGLRGKRGFRPKDRMGGAPIVPQNDLRSVTVGSSRSSRPNKQKSRPLRNGFLVWSCPADSNCRLSVACGNQQPLRSNTRFARSSAVLTAADRTNKKAVPCGTAFLFGAARQIRTAGCPLPAATNNRCDPIRASRGGRQFSCLFSDKTKNHIRRCGLMELLSRFELPTSSLPMTCSAY